MSNMAFWIAKAPIAQDTTIIGATGGEQLGEPRHWDSQHLHRNERAMSLNLNGP